jgi:hypothetical protein
MEVGQPPSAIHVVESAYLVFAVAAFDGELQLQLSRVGMPSAGGLEEAVRHVDLMMLVGPSGPKPDGVGLLGRQVMGTVIGVARLRLLHVLQRATEAQPVVCDVGELSAFIAPYLYSSF